MTVVIKKNVIELPKEIYKEIEKYVNITPTS